MYMYVHVNKDIRSVFYSIINTHVALLYAMYLR
jgi:hypothetical protein